LDRLTYSTEGAGNTFYNQEKFFRKNETGLYFLLKTDKIDLLAPVLKFLEDSGLGTNKYTGKNHFKAEIKEKEITLNTKGNSFVTLSKYVEKNKDKVDFSKSYYETDFMRFKIESREEFSGENIWKNIIPYIREGSVITLKQESEYPGEIFPIKQIQGKTIYQYGFAYPYRGDFGK